MVGEIVDSSIAEPEEDDDDVSSEDDADEFPCLTQVIHFLAPVRRQKQINKLVCNWWIKWHEEFSQIKNYNIKLGKQQGLLLEFLTYYMSYKGITYILMFKFKYYDMYFWLVFFMRLG